MNESRYFEIKEEIDLIEDKTIRIESEDHRNPNETIVKEYKLVKISLGSGVGEDSNMSYRPRCIIQSDDGEELNKSLSDIFKCLQTNHRILR